MAPRRIKKGLTRMDAALEHMSLMGFSKQHVRKTVKNLLKVYGGEGAWSLIEEDGYRVLIEVLLTEQEAGGSQNQIENNMVFLLLLLFFNLSVINFEKIGEARSFGLLPLTVVWDWVFDIGILFHVMFVSCIMSNRCCYFGFLIFSTILVV